MCIAVARFYTETEIGVSKANDGFKKGNALSPNRVSSLKIGRFAQRQGVEPNKTTRQKWNVTDLNEMDAVDAFWDAYDEEDRAVERGVAAGTKQEHPTVTDTSVSVCPCRHGEHLGWVEGWQLGVRHGYTVGTDNSMNHAPRNQASLVSLTRS